MKGATPKYQWKKTNRRCFNSRSREGSDVIVDFLIGEESVSIHAPVKGATTLGSIYRESKGVSIHAPVKGATDKLTLNTLSQVVSIHAPVKGATIQEASI